MSLALRTRSSTLAGLVLIASIMCADGRAFAATTGTIVGTVTDQATHQAIAGASVDVMATTGTYHATTDKHGFFAVVDAFPSSYLLSASAPAYDTAETYGGSVNPNQTIVVDIQLDKTSMRVTTDGAANPLSIVSRAVPLDEIVLTGGAANGANGSGGSYGLYQTPGILGTQPGVTLDEGVNAHIRGGRLDEVGYDFDGVSAVDPITGLAATNLLEDGIVRLQATGDGDASASAAALDGSVEAVIGVGSYPPHGAVTQFIQSPTFYHGTNFQYGAATPDQRFSWFASGVMWNSGYDWGQRGSFVPGEDSLETAYGDSPVGAVSPARDQVVNLHFRPDADDDVQLLASSGFERFDNTIAAEYWPSTNPLYGPSESPTPVSGLCDGNGLALFPGQPSCTASTTGVTDHIDQNFSVAKLELTHAFTSSTSLSVTYAGLSTAVDAYYPFGDGPFADLWGDQTADQHQSSAQYDAQVGGDHLLSAGVSAIASDNLYQEAFVSSGYGVVAPASTRDESSWIQDRYRASDRLTLQGAVRSEARTYDRVAAPSFTDTGMEGQFAGAYAVGDRTVVRASYGNDVQMPFASRVERIVTQAPDFFDLSNPQQRIESHVGVPQTHDEDVSIERSLSDDMELRVTPFWSRSDDLVVTRDAALSAPVAAGLYFVNGIEMEAQLLHAGAFTGFIDYTHTRAQASGTGDFTQSVGSGALAAHALFPVAFISPDVANAVLTWHRAKWIVGPEIDYSGGYPYGVGRLTYNSLNCPQGSATTGGDPAEPCGAIVRNPAAYRNAVDGNCVPGSCTQLLDPGESAFADGRTCCSQITANLSVTYDLAARTQVGVQWLNLTHNTQPLALAPNPYYPQSQYGPAGFNGFVDYGATPYIPAAVDNSEEFLFFLTEKV